MQKLSYVSIIRLYFTGPALASSQQHILKTLNTNQHFSLACLVTQVQSSCSAL